MCLLAVSVLWCQSGTSHYIMVVFGFVQCITPSVWNLMGPSHPAQHSRKDLGEEPITATMAITAHWNDPEARKKRCSQQFSHGRFCRGSFVCLLAEDRLLFSSRSPEIAQLSRRCVWILFVLTRRWKKLVLNAFFHCVYITFLATITAAICVFCDAETATAMSFMFSKSQCVC